MYFCQTHPCACSNTPTYMRAKGRAIHGMISTIIVCVSYQQLLTYFLSLKMRFMMRQTMAKPMPIHERMVQTMNRAWLMQTNCSSWGTPAEMRTCHYDYIHTYTSSHQDQAVEPPPPYLCHLFYFLLDYVMWTVKQWPIKYNAVSPGMLCTCTTMRHFSHVNRLAVSLLCERCQIQFRLTREDDTVHQRALIRVCTNELSYQCSASICVQHIAHTCRA